MFQTVKKPFRGDRHKFQPDGTDETIIERLSVGCRPHEIARELYMSIQSVERRLLWMQARRWVTADLKLLTKQKRDKLLEMERKLAK